MQVSLLTMTWLLIMLNEEGEDKKDEVRAKEGEDVDRVRYLRG